MNDKIPVCSFCAATVKPDVVFFGEDLPQEYFLHSKDFPKADLLIIMGTSLQVNVFNLDSDITVAFHAFCEQLNHERRYCISEKKPNTNMFQIEPFASLVNTVRSTVPRLLLNRHAVGPFEKVPLRRGDHMELGDLEVTVRRFAEMLGWNIEIEELMRTQETLVSSIVIKC